MKPEVLVLMHVCRYFRPEGFREVWETELLGLLELVDALYLRYDRVEGAAVVFRGCVVACPSCFFQGRCVGWHGLGRVLVVVVPVAWWCSVGGRWLGGSCWLCGVGCGLFTVVCKAGQETGGEGGDCRRVVVLW